MITINGKPQDIREGVSLLELLEDQGFRLGVIAVEYNGKVIKKDAYSEIQLHNGDKLEVVSFVGGG